RCGTRADAVELDLAQGPLPSVDQHLAEDHHRESDQQRDEDEQAYGRSSHPAEAHAAMLAACLRCVMTLSSPSRAWPIRHDWGMPSLSARAQAFLEANRSAGRVPPRRDVSAHAVRVGVALVDGKVWSSGTQDRVRTRHLRRDPRATLFVFGKGYEGLTFEEMVRILEAPH